MIDLANIRSLSDFQRNAKAHIRRLKKSGKPEVLTVNGQAEIVVQSAEAYQKLLEAAGMAGTIEGIRRGLSAAKQGKERPLREFLRELAAKHGVELK